MHQTITTIIKSLNSRKQHVYIIGDVNINFLRYNEHTNTEDYLNMLYSNNFLPLITKPTRLTDHSSTLIDHIYTNTINSLVSGIVKIDISDHFPIFCLAGTSLKKSCRKLFFRDYSKFNSDLYLHDICAMDWKAVTDQCKDLHEATTCTINALKSIVDKHAPIKQVSSNKERLLKKPWISRGILKSIKTKHTMYKTHFLSKDPVKVKNLRNIQID